jgi:hypothetical protein
MLLPRSSVLATAALLLHSALAQVPDTLSKGFETEIQVNFQGNSAQGFSDGDTIPFPDTEKVPVFALGDASGVNTRISYTILMIDTTDQNNFIMHYLKSNFKATGEKTGLESDSTPKVAYAKPGSLGESGERQYTFLLYLMKGSTDLQSVPQAGEKFDYEAFGAANNLEPPTAGVAMKVSIGDNSTPAESSPPSSAATPTAAPTSADVPSTTTSSTTTMTMASATPSSSDKGKADSGKEGLTQKLSFIFVGGGIVSEQPFPTGAGGEIVNAIASMVSQYGSVMSPPSRLRRRY